MASPDDNDGMAHAEVGQSAGRRSRLWPLVVLILGLAVLVLVGYGLSLYAGLGKWQSLTTPPERFAINGPTINQVQSLSLLTVQSVQVVSELEAEASFRKGVWIVRGSADYVVDFSLAKSVSRDEDGKVVTISLPSPKLRNPRLDEQRTKLVTVEKTGLGWWTIGMMGSQKQFEEISRDKMQSAVVAAAREQQYVVMARQSAERVVRSIFELAGWKVQIEWEP